METQARIQQASHRLRVACTVMIWALPVVVGLYWLGLNYAPEWMSMTLRNQLPVRIQGQLPLWSLGLAYLMSMLQGGVAIYALIQLRRLFGLYELGIIFEIENVVCLRKVGKAIIVWSVGETFCNALVGIAVTLPNPPGQRLLTLGLTSSQVLALFAGFMVLTIAWVMEEGRKMQVEQSLIV